MTQHFVLKCSSSFITHKESNLAQGKPVYTTTWISVEWKSNVYSIMQPHKYRVNITGEKMLMGAVSQNLRFTGIIKRCGFTKPLPVVSSITRCARCNNNHRIIL